MTKRRSQETEQNRQGSVESSNAPSTGPHFLVIGRILRPHGVRGELRVEIHTQLPERFTWLDEVYIARDADDPSPRLLAVDGVRFHKGYALMQFEGYASREAAEGLRGYWLLVPEAEAIPLEEGEVYLFQLQGLVVYTDEGERLGELVEVLETGANEVFVVRGPRGDVLLPNTAEVVQDVDLDAGRITVHLLEGLI